MVEIRRMAENRPPPRRSTIPPPIERVEPASTPDLSRPPTRLATDVVALPPEKTESIPRHAQRDVGSDHPPASYAPKPGVVARKSTIPARDNDVDSPMPEARPARSASIPPPAYHAEVATPAASQTTLAEIDREESRAPRVPVRTMTVKMTAVSAREPRGPVSNAVADAIPSGPFRGLPAARVLPQPLDPRLVLLIDPDSARSASYRSLRDMLLGKGLPRVLAITSPRPNEGKTTCAVNLALALAEQPPTRVLLLDGNFFSPCLAGIFTIDASTSEATPRAHPSGPDDRPTLDLGLLAPYRISEISGGLHVAAIVRDSGEPVRRFDGRWLEQVVGHLRASSYDHVIIDAAALEGSPNVTQLISVADATLLTVRSSASTTGALRRAAEQIPPRRGIGVVLMDA